MKQCRYCSAYYTGHTPDDACGACVRRSSIRRWHDSADLTRKLQSRLDYNASLDARLSPKPRACATCNKYVDDHALCYTTHKYPVPLCSLKDAPPNSSGLMTV